MVQSSVRVSLAGFLLKGWAGPERPSTHGHLSVLPKSFYLQLEILRAFQHSKTLELLLVAARLRELKDKLPTIFLFFFCLPIGTVSVLEWKRLLLENSLLCSARVWPLSPF